MTNARPFPIDRQIKLDNRMEELSRLNEQLEEIGVEAGWSDRAVLDLSLACEELITNIVNYGFPMGGEHRIDVLVTASPATVEVRIEDTGVPFNPLQENSAAALLDLELEDRPIGGLGIFFVKRLMDHVHYERSGDRNCFRMSKVFIQEEKQQDEQRHSGGQ